MPKSGVKTSEFWVTIATLLAGFLTMMGWITPEMGQDMPVFVGQIAGGVIGMVAIVMYVWSRVRVKAR